MKKLLLAAMAVLSFLVSLPLAAACVPAVAPVYEFNAEGAAVGWWCPGLVEPTLALYAVRWHEVTPQLAEDVRKVAGSPTLAGIERLRATYATTPLADLEPVWSPARDRIQAAKPPAVVIARAVAPNGTVLTRPASALAADGTRTATTVRAPVGAACDCRERGVLEGTSAYCAYAGSAPPLVALCRAVTPPASN